MRTLLTLSALAVAAAQSYFCGTCANGGAPPMANTMLTIACPAGTTVTAIQFASYGNPSGQCGNFKTGTCNAANSTSVASALCLNQQQCVIFPNTTTFGDPCFGTVKELAVQATCSSGLGTATCSVLPPPPPPPLPNVTATVTAAWGTTAATTTAVPSLQVVSQHLLMRDSPIHDQSFQTLAQLGNLQYTRFVPWLPYPKLGVAELDPPSGAKLCGPAMWAAGQIQPFTLDCGEGGGTISSVDFASYGTATGTCNGGYAINAACHAANSTAVVTAKCVGQATCSLGPSDFGPSAPCNAAYVAVSVTCSGTRNYTYYNFTLLDNLYLDYYNAVGCGNADALCVPNWSTQPNWIYDPTDYTYVDDAAQPWYGYERGAAADADLSALGDYYGRLVAWYTRGGFTDEYGYYHSSGHTLNMPVYEVFNEVDYEHGNNPQTYTAQFDAVVAGIRAHADPARSMRFVGLSLPNIDSTDTVVAFATYFLNASNHNATVWDANASAFIGYHAYPTNGPYTPDPTSFSLMFDYVDSLVTKVQAVDAVIAALSPHTRTLLDECGTDMDGVLTPGVPPPANNPRYWVASAAYHAYLWARVNAVGTSVLSVGASQWMDAPGQEPSVTMLDWSSGLGTARVWVIKLLLDHTAVGDAFVTTTTTTTSSSDSGSSAATANATAVYAQAYLHSGAYKVLLINKVNAFATVTLPAAPAAATGTGGWSSCVAEGVDETTGTNPARPLACSVNGGAGGLPQLQLYPFSTAVVTLA